MFIQVILYTAKMLVTEVNTIIVKRYHCELASYPS